MRILFISPHQLWPVNTGARLRNFHLAAALATRCPVTLLQVLQGDEEEISDPAARVFTQALSARKDKSYTAGKLFKGLLGPLPLNVLNYQSAGVRDCLRRLLGNQQFDTVHLASIHLFPYLDLFRDPPHSPSVLLDWHNMESELMRRFAAGTRNIPKKIVARRTADLLKTLESQALEACQAHTVVSERERIALLERNSNAPVHVIPNGVDVSALSSPDSNQRSTALLFVGSMDYHANIDAVTWFAQAVWPQLAAEFPDLEFVIAGRAPSCSVRALVSDTVHVTGTVPDVRPFYSNALALIVPLRVGGGTRLKILEAMALGVPVISTTLGAEGINITNNRNILLADSEQDIIIAVKRVAQEPELRRRLIAAGKALVADQYDWASIGHSIFEIHRNLSDARIR